ncbi:hypothetical protein A2U01_0056061, partial [Trifolium medium]|nr:hypothetical protein [Trifolium medium]
ALWKIRTRSLNAFRKDKEEAEKMQSFVAVEKLMRKARKQTRRWEETIAEEHAWEEQNTVAEEQVDFTFSFISCSKPIVVRISDVE